MSRKYRHTAGEAVRSGEIHQYTALFPLGMYLFALLMHCKLEL